LKKFLSNYGLEVAGYSVRVLNEREARAAAGILFALGLIGLFNSVALGHLIFTKVFLSFFVFDFFIRILNPSYSPSLLIGRIFIRHQQPEYVGAVQKRFAWLVGFVLSVPMFYYIVIDFQPNIWKIPLCVVCLVLLFLESAFSICVGCKLYNIFSKEPPTLCPGGSCELKTKDPVQTFSLSQKIIAIITIIVMLFAFYLYFYKVENKTFLAKKFSRAFMSDKEIEALEFQKQEAEFEKDDE